MFAYIDESIAYDAMASQRIYTLVAVLVPYEVIDHARHHMVTLRPRGAKKLHWHAASPELRLQIAETLTELEVFPVLCQRAQPQGESEERGRRICLKTSLSILGRSGVSLATAESRGPAQDRRDIALVKHLRSSRWLESRLTLMHAPGPSEPLLWLADAVCGASTARFAGHDDYFDLLARRMQLEVHHL